MAIEPPTVLAVEDEGMIAMELEDMLEDLGYEVLGPAATVEDACALMRVSVPDVAVIDMNLAGASALPVLQALEAAGVPFVLASGYEKSELKTFGLDGPLVKKPYSARDLARAFHAVGVSPSRSGT